MSKKPIWLDCDTGVDDSFALVTAAKDENLDILGISVTVGNTTVDNGFENTRNVLAMAGRSDIKVYKGARKPLVRSASGASEFHGEDGIGGVKLETSGAKREEKLAWDALYETLKAYGDKVTVCTIGPLTNIAIAIAKYPDLVNYVKEINMMGGAAEKGNVTPCAEFNVYHDPEAAENVFKSGIPVNMFGLDVTLKANLTKDDLSEIASIGNKTAKTVVEMTKLPLAYLSTADHQEDICLHDSLPVIYVNHPELFEGKECGVFVETQGTITLGKTCTDIWTDFKYDDRHCKVFLNVDREAVVSITKESFRKC